MSSEGRLAGKVAIISGGARGIGAEAARQFVREGARVVVADLLHDEGKSLADELGESARFHWLDVRDPDAWTEVVDECTSSFGAPNVLAANAGVMVSGLLQDLTADDFRRAFDVNVLGVFHGIRAVVEPMKAEGGGSIVVTSSLCGMPMAAPSMGAYGVSKAGNVSLSRHAAIEYGRYNIRVNAICPGGVNTELGRGRADEDKTIDAIFAGLPLGRMATTAEIANTITFLASDESAYTTGAEFVMDGGLRAGRPPAA